MTRRNMLNLLLLLSLLLPSLSAAAQGYAQQAQQAYEQSRRLKDMDDFPNALSAIQCAVRLMPDSDIYWDWMSWCEFLLGLHAEGEEHALRSVRLNPQNPEHYMLVGLNAQGNQDFDLARDYFRRTLSFGPQRMRPDQYADATRRLEYLMGKKYTLFWKLDANQAPQPTVSL
jgi:tetratricopeptide (TPR) repeat protein